MAETEEDIEAPIRMLLVENDPESGPALLNMLVKRGVETVLECSAETALKRFESGGFDVVVADIRLDGMSGVELLEVIRKRDGAFPVILLTGYDSLASAIEAVRLGAQDYILKPLESIDDLLSPVSRAVDAFRVARWNTALESNLRESERRLRTVLEHSVDIIYRVDVAGCRVDYVSPSVTATLGYTQDEVLAMEPDGLLDAVHPDDRAQVRSAAVALTAAGGGVRGPRTLECRVRGRDGEYRWLSISHSLMDRDGAGAMAVVGNARDISERKESETVERRLREKLARVARLESMSLVAGGIAHDLNNILVPALTVTDVLLEDLTPDGRFPDPGQARDDMEAVQQSVRHAAAIIRHLLTLGRRGKYEPEPVALDDVVREYMRTAGFRTLAAKHRGVDVYDRPAGGAVMVNGSKPHLSQALMNLVANAFHAMPAGGRLTIETRSVVVADPIVGYEVIPAGRYAVLRIADTGGGIAADDMDRLFEPFFSRKNMDDAAGTGLGLFVVHGVVRDHNGFIDVRNVEGGGTEFLLYLPMLREKDGQQPGESVR